MKATKSSSANPPLSVNNPTLLLFTSKAGPRVTVKAVLKGFKMAFLTSLKSIICSLHYCQRCSALLKWLGGGWDVGVERAAPFPLRLALACSAGYCSLSATLVCACVCVHCVLRLISVTLSSGDEAGQITLSAQPTHPAQNEECEQQSDKLYYCIFHSKLLCAEVTSCSALLLIYSII